MGKSAFENSAPVDGKDAKAEVEDDAVVAAAAPAKQEGGKRKRRRTRRKVKKAKKSRKSRKTRKSKKSKTRKKKRKLNPFFKLMLAAKKAGKQSFKYLGRTYKGRKHPRLGMIYKKA
jgi:hypothetical protein|uniref:Uncharacterized protein n=1 Tax=viral metagenome TaxID=1070528 RepID=A0A6C0BZE5_9ZZZZ